MTNSNPVTPVADRAFVKKAMQIPLLGADQEKELALRWRDEGDEKALHTLTSAYMRLVVSMAGRFRNYGLLMADLVQEGNVGLMQAAARFEPEREVRFSTYASWWIRSSIQDYILRNWSIVRTGTTSAQKSLFFNLRRLRALINDHGDSGVTPENRAFIAKELRVKESDVEQMASRLSAADRSLNAPLADGGDAEWQDLLADESALPEAETMQKFDTIKRADWINQALQSLSEREETIIRQRQMADQEEIVTLEALGRKLGISKERVRQIEHQALLKLRKALTDIVGDPKDAGLIPSL